MNYRLPESDWDMVQDSPERLVYSANNIRRDGHDDMIEHGGIDLLRLVVVLGPRDPDSRAGILNRSNRGAKSKIPAPGNLGLNFLHTLHGNVVRLAIGPLCVLDAINGWEVEQCVVRAGRHTRHQG